MNHKLDPFLRDYFPDLYHKPLIDEFNEKSILIHMKASEILVDYGSYIKSVPLVVDGTVKVLRHHEDGREIFLYYITGGDTCAATFSCCMVRKRSEIQAIAEEDSRIIMVPLEAADSWMSKYPAWRNYIFNMYDKKMYQLIDIIDLLVFGKLDEQLLDYLERTALSSGNKTIYTTHQSIARDLNVSREAVSRLLKKLEQNGKVLLGRNSIVLNF